jgi:hypothetical protein
MARLTEDCRKRKKEGDLFGVEWMLQTHMRFCVWDWSMGPSPPPSSRPILFCEARRKLSLFFFLR